MRRINILPKSKVSTAFIIASLLVQAVFMFFIVVLDILPIKYASLLVLILVVFNFVQLCLLNDGLRGRKKRILRPIGRILCVLMASVLALGSIYLYNTAETLIDISKGKTNIEKYYVVVAKDSKYEEVDEIKGREVYVTDDESKMYNEAKEKLVTKVDVKYIAEPGVSDLKGKFSKPDAAKDEEIIFLSRNNYELICEDDKTFKKDTRKLYAVDVEIKSDDVAKRINVTEDPFNIYITGIDVWGDIDQVSRSDVNMIVTVNPKTKTVLLTSMPRDSYVVLHSFGEYDKLTHSGIYGVEETIATVEDWLDVEINYYIRANFSMVVDLVNAIDGISVNSDFAFKSKVSDYTYVVGENKLDGKAALYFARERKAFEDEDEERIRNQQKVLKAIIKKATNSKVILTNYVDILNSVEGHMQTNMSNKDISSLVKMQLNDMSGWKIETISVDGNDDYRGTMSMGMGRELFVSIPKEKSVERVNEKIHEVMYPVED